MMQRWWPPGTVCAKSPSASERRTSWATRRRPPWITSFDTSTCIFEALKNLGMALGHLHAHPLLQPQRALHGGHLILHPGPPQPLQGN
ncbi:hypothetical protein NHX12_032768 [Muraenolepis orangiensis]|uniref:Uncharacterized protein n=1 Tax=Muraenolepis orangiensis TaxID=630683 RepID=A0A9Q0E0C4_9TELE|nr:hypothetical protein NHX12_032768 [Muraenolepis orangiensis]